MHTDQKVEGGKMNLGKEKLAVGILATNEETESALNQLRDSGFSLEKIGVIAKDSGRPSHRGNAKLTNTIPERGQAGASMGVATGTAQGGLGGLLIGFGRLAIPGGGRVIAAESMGTEIANILGSNGIGAFPDSWVRVLAGMGIPEKQASVYSNLVEKGNCLVMLEVTHQEIAKAEQILNESGIQEWELFDSETNEKVRSNSETSTIQAKERKVSDVGYQANSPTNV
jgi:hypothetical protein